MKNITLSKACGLQKETENIRNICILAHVDHGKTTLADCLVASNGIISQKMAGKLRYLDSREDEQLRGITMKSSAISLLFKMESSEYLINLIDSPGHVDFSSEVSTAVRLCDGAIVVVDVVEGVCPQTHAVLRQAWLENIRPILVFNKMDRLILELKMSPLEAYLHLQNILEQVNAITGELFTSEVLERNTHSGGATEKKSAEDISEDQVYDWSTGLEDTDDSNLYFSPDQNNVVFASAIDGWAFGISHFARLYATKLGLSETALKKTLWGDFYLDNKTKRIRKGAQGKGKKALFVQFILENLWSVYDTFVVSRDKEKMEKVVKSLGVTIPARDARHSDPRVQLCSLCSQWLPLAQAVLGTVVDKLPSPRQMSPERAETLICPRGFIFNNLMEETRNLKNVFLQCHSDDSAPIILYVSKLFPIERKHMPQHKPKPLSADEVVQRREMARQRHAERMAAKPDEQKDETTAGHAPATYSDGEMTELTPTEEVDMEETVFIAFARIFSGTVTKGKKLYILNPRHNPAKALMQDDENWKHVFEFEVKDLYLFMGRELEQLDEVPAGNILGLGGMEEFLVRSGTVSSTLACPAFTDLHLQTAPIVRVALEPMFASDFKALERGLKLLNQADACVDVTLETTGELIVVAAGEVHLQKCIDDLKLRYAKVEFSVSEPQVAFRETIVPPPTVDIVGEEILEQIVPTRKEEDVPQDGDEKEKDGSITVQTRNRVCSLKILARPLPASVTDLLESHSELLRILHKQTKNITEKNQNNKVPALSAEVQQKLLTLKTSLQEAFDSEGEEWKGLLDNVWSFGPKRCGPNMLVNMVQGYVRPSVWQCLGTAVTQASGVRDYDYCIVNGFQLATSSGPLCEEPMRGVCFVIEGWEYVTSASQTQAVGVHKDSGEISEYLSLLTCDEDNMPDCPVEEKLRKEAFGPFSGQLISAMKEGCRRAFQEQPQRLMWAMYSCSVQATAEVLGRMYAVLGRRNGRILAEDMREGSSVFIVDAVMPVVESFGFAEEFRKKTSGLAIPQLQFSHWEVIDMDPFWEPTTEEEYLHFGEKADSENIARRYMNLTRRRKGLSVKEKLVEFAEKQRTLGKNK